MHHPTPMLPLPLQVETTVGVQQSQKKKKRSITDDTLRATTNASRYMDALRFTESQSFMHGPRL